MPNMTSASHSRNQRGVVLVTVLLLVVMALLIGATVITANTLEEHMAGNSRDYNIAFQAAEAGLRDGEFDVANNTWGPDFPYSPTCAGGACARPPTSTEWWADTANFSWASQSVQYGSVSGAPPWSGSISEQPRYIVEKPLLVPVVGSVKQGEKPPPTLWAYRVTAVGFGNRGVAGSPGQTNVVVQSIFVK